MSRGRKAVNAKHPDAIILKLGGMGQGWSLVSRECLVGFHQIK